LHTVGAIDRLAHANHLFDDLDEAIAHAHDHVRRRHQHLTAHAELEA
jgi:SulP family sulfate permease